MSKIGIFSGTFDPIHKGHEWLVDHVLGELVFDQVIILVEPQPRRKTGVTDFQRRCAMVELAFKDMPNVVVNPVEIKDSSHTIEHTMQAIRDYAPKDSELWLLMGGDVFEYVPQWDRIDSIIESVGFVVALRTEDDGETAVAVKSQQLPGVKAQLISSQHSGVSSTIIRSQLASQGESDKVAPAVLEYIQKEGLYGAKQTTAA